MAEIISCPSCQRKLQVPETLVGQDVQCPSCGATFVARTTGSAPPPPAYRPPDREADRRENERRDDRQRYGGAAYDDDFGEEYGSRRRRRDLAPHRGTMILVFGVLSLAACPFFGPVAWILGNNDMAEIRAGNMDPEGEGMTQAGRICGMIGTAFIVLGACFIGLSILGEANRGPRF